MDCPDAWGEPDFEGFPYPITESCTAAFPVASMFRWSETSRILTPERGNHQPVILLLSGEVIRRSNPERCCYRCEIPRFASPHISWFPCSRVGTRGFAALAAYLTAGFEYNDALERLRMCFHTSSMERSASYFAVVSVSHSPGVKPDCGVRFSDVRQFVRFAGVIR